MTSLDGVEFIRRLLLHILPHRFVRIRYYGLLANAQRSKSLEHCRALLRVPPPRGPEAAEPPETWQERLERLTSIDPTRCLVCGEGCLQLLGTPVRSRRDSPTTTARAPP